MNDRQYDHLSDEELLDAITEALEQVFKANDTYARLLLEAKHRDLEPHP